MLTFSKESLLEKARLLQSKIEIETTIEPCEDFVGGGSAPDVRLDGYAITIHSNNFTTEQIERQLRKNNIPIICHITQDKIWLHLRTLLDEDFDVIAKCLQDMKG